MCILGWGWEGADKLFQPEAVHWSTSRFIMNSTIGGHAAMQQSELPAFWVLGESEAAETCLSLESGGSLQKLYGRLPHSSFQESVGSGRAGQYFEKEI